MPHANDPATPLVIRSDDGLALFRSVAAARAHLEVPDVEAGVYGPGFDAEGRLLAIEAPQQLFEPEPKRGLRRMRWRVVRSFNPVEIRVAEDEPTHQSQLKELLASVLEEFPSNAAKELPDLNLEELLDRAIARFGVI